MITTAKDLRFHAKEILETTMRGESVVVTYHGKPAAKIIPYSGKETVLKKRCSHNLFGIWKDRASLGDAAPMSVICAKAGSFDYRYRRHRLVSAGK